MKIQTYPPFPEPEEPVLYLKLVSKGAAVVALEIVDETGVRVNCGTLMEFRVDGSGHLYATAEPFVSSKLPVRMDPSGRICVSPNRL
jgi:hypothetical protein